MNVKENLEAVTQRMYNKTVKELDDSQLYLAILNMTKDMMKDKGAIKGTKKIYYINSCIKLNIKSNDDRNDTYHDNGYIDG